MAAAVSVLLALIAKMYPADWIRRRGLKILIKLLDQHHIIKPQSQLDLGLKLHRVPAPLCVPASSYEGTG